MRVRLRGALELGFRALDVPNPEEEEPEVETDDARPWMLAGERPEPGERCSRFCLLEAAHGVRHPGVEIVRVELERVRERGRGRNRPAGPLEGGSVEQVGLHASGLGPRTELLELPSGWEPLQPLRRLEARVEVRSPRGHVGMEQILRPEGSCRIRVGLECLAPLRPRRGILFGRVVGKPEMEADESRPWLLFGQGLEPAHCPVRPARDRRPHGRFERLRVVPEHALESLARLARVPVVIQALRCSELARLRVVPQRDAELERRRAALRPRGGLRLVSPAHERRTHGDSGSGQGGRAGDQANARAGGHETSLARRYVRCRFWGQAGLCPAEYAARPGAQVAIFGEATAMPNYRELLQQVKSEIDEVDSSRGRELIEDESAQVIDVRERDEWDEGHLPGAVHVPRGHLESRIERAAPDRDAPVLLYCASGSRSAFAAKTLEELGYQNVVSLAGGFTDWKRNGLPFEIPQALDEPKRRRYSRHLLIPEVGEEGQLRLLESRVLLIGAGGLGSPASLYLAAAGVGTLGIVDDDIVDETNLQRQIVHSTERLGESKAESAKRTIEALNPDVTVNVFRERLTFENVDRILGGEGWDVIVDGADNFPTRYLLNDASVWHRIPVVHGSIFRFEGQTTVFKPHEGPCYRCLFPQPPPPELAPSCAEGGVLGVLPGVIGSLQANEALKLALEIGEPLVGRLLMFDALEATFTEIKLRRDPDCPVCGENPTITDYIDYVEFCQGGRTEVTS
jgi:sulfur-carrier protein adenylyltransferase/sulfurtransferase